ncbi:protein neprosin-like [Phragmites australis]|uniref:protein neprosin-like n=1 Tax=Phragmites australis TaxID=29695 RepID=UPI002D783C40|nr:protein neprosin-like [Phragmites australis]
MDLMEILLLVAVCFLLYAPTGSSGDRSHPASHQAVSPREDLSSVQPHVGRAEIANVMRDSLSRFHMSAINVTSSTRQEMGPVSTLADDQPGAAGNYFAVQETERGSGDYHGFVATLDVYGFSLSPQQLSRAAIWVMNVGDRTPSSLNVIELGWEVSPFLYGDSKTHFVTVWTRDGYKETGCYNTKCPGFEAESGATIAPGGIIDTVSQPPNGLKQNLTLKLVKDGASGDWLVHYGLNNEPELIGRFPNSIFTGLADKATNLHFGGLAASSTTNRPAPPMGSGFLPPAAASFSNIQLIDHNGEASLLTRELPRVTTNRSLYHITPIVNGGFFYGGPSQPTT